METLSLKLKLEPSIEQTQVLDKLFWKWASICTRLGLKKVKKSDLTPPEDVDGIWFSKTQLGQANTDVNDLRKAMQHQARRIEWELDRVQNRRNEIQDALEHPDRRDVSPERKDMFRPKAAVEKGYLKLKYHKLSRWQRELKTANKLIERKNKTLNKIRAGKIRFKPTRITLHSNSFRLKFGNAPKLQLSVTADHQKIELPLIVSLERPLRTKYAEKSKLYLDSAILNFLAYCIDASLFGLSRSEKMLLKSKKAEKIKKRDLKLAKKKTAFNKKLSYLEKIIERKLSEKEKNILEQKQKEFLGKFEVTLDREYVETLRHMAAELVSKNNYLNLNRYPTLLRRPERRLRANKLKNLKPEEWKYYIQFGFKPLLNLTKGIQPKTVLGIDRGLKHLLAVSILNPETKTFVFNRLYPNHVVDWKRRRRKLLHSIKRLKRRLKSEKHINLHKKKFRSLEKRIENYYHNLSKELVDLAKENNSVIVVENLGGMRQHGRGRSKWQKALNYALSNFSYAKIMQLVAYKAELAGVSVYDINPAGTSGHCAYCLLNGKDSTKYVRGITVNGEKNNKIGKCDSCGKQFDADLNAARVIAICKIKNLNDPQLFGTRKQFKAKKT